MARLNDRLLPRWCRRLLFPLLVVLAGCQPQAPGAPLEEYLVRVARVVGATAEVPEPEPLPRYPERRALAVDIPQHSIDVANFIELHGCDMGELVGFRNSPLGRLQAPSQRLGYEAAWLAAVAGCAADADADAGADADGWLGELRDDKRAALPALFWNATFAAEEMRAALGFAARPAADDFADLLRGLSDRLTALEADEFELNGLERLLGTLRQGSWAGPARRDWARWRGHLDAVATLLDDAAPRLCLNRQPTPRSRRLYNVFVLFYVEAIQPELALRMREHEAWIAELARLSQRLEAVQPEAYRAWFDAVVAPQQPSSEWRRTQASVLNHARAWQEIFTSCAIEPGVGLGQH
ncbi:MAG: DUF3080 family protein [Pseudomonadales bacterium]